MGRVREIPEISAGIQERSAHLYAETLRQLNVNVLPFPCKSTTRPCVYTGDVVNAVIYGFD